MSATEMSSGHTQFAQNCGPPLFPNMGINRSPERGSLANANFSNPSHSPEWVQSQIPSWQGLRVQPLAVTPTTGRSLSIPYKKRGFAPPT